MSVQWDPWTGRPSELESVMKQRISAYVREVGCGDYKIGITNDPERRFREYKSSDDVYDRMIVIYQSKSWKSVTDFEKRMVDYYIEYDANLTRGGGGSYGAGPYYMYVVIRD